MFVYRFHAVVDIPSENYLYKPGHTGRHSYLYKNPVIHEFQEKFKTLLSHQIDRQIFPPIKLVTGLLVRYLFYVKNSFHEKDLTNMVKAPEDAFFSLLPYDDSMVISNFSRKLRWRQDEIDLLLVVLLGDESNGREFIQENLWTSWRE